MSLVETVDRAGGADRASPAPPDMPTIDPLGHRGKEPRVSRPWSRWTFALCALAVTAMTAAAFARWQIAGAVVPWDSKNHFYPMFRFLGDALRHGTVPLWNPYHFAGYPAVADPQSLLFTPSMVLFALVAPDATMPVFDAVIFAHLTLGAIGMLGLARRWRWHPLAALLCAIVFAFGGTAASRLQHTGMIISYAWFPLALWSLLAALDSPGRGLGVYARACIAGVFAALMALGRDQVAFLLCLTLVGAVACEAAGMPEPRAFLRGRTPRLLVAAAVTLACTLVPILLTLQFLRDSNRPGIPFGMALEGSLDPVNLLTAIAPNVFGSLDTVYDYWGPGAATIAGNDWTDRTIDYLFVGTLPLVLLVWHGLAGARLFERGARAFTLMLAAALIYALGRNTILFSLIFDWLPGVSLYRRPADATFLMTIALAFLAGHLLHRYIAAGLPRPRPRVAWPSALGTLIAVAVLVGFGLSFARAAGHASASRAALAESVALALAVAVLMVVARGARHRTRVAAMLVAATAAQLLWRNCASPLNAEPASAYSAYAGLYPDEAGGVAVLKRELAARAAEGAYPRVEILGLNGSWQNAAMVFKIEDTLGYNPLRIADYERAVGVGESANDPKLRSFPDTFRGYNSRLAGLLGLEYLMIDRPLDELPRHVPRPAATLLYASEDVFLYRLQPPPAPRVYVASQVVPVDDAAVLAAGTLPAFDLPRQALLDRADLSRLSPALSSRRDANATAHATMTRHDDDRVVVDVESHGGLLVLHDLAYPGWVATVDGERAPVLRANLLFRGVEVPPGHHTVEFAYHPFAMSNLVSALGRLLKGHR